MRNQKFSYTTLANRYTARFPFLTYVGTQINFWIIANALLVVLLHLWSKILSLGLHVDVSLRIRPQLLIAVLFGVFYGLVYGCIGYYLEQRNLRRWPLGKVLIFKTSVSVLLLWALLYMIRMLPHRLFADASLQMGPLDDRIWRYIFYLLVVFYFFMALLITYINQVNKKYGPGVLIPLLLGKYREPMEEQRIFMFMDLKSSTASAEQLGHFRYSAFIRDCFEDISEQLHPYRAQVYQYVGDEIVVMWPESEGLKNMACIHFFLACKKKFRERESYYTAHYQQVPEFKAGMHCGKVTAVEIGQIKKDIAYHGDTLNTAARIQSVCNEYQRDFLVSEYLMSKLQPAAGIHTQPLGRVLLRGKTDPVAIVSLTV